MEINVSSMISDLIEDVAFAVCDIFFLSFCLTRVSRMLIELQSLLANGSILSKAQLLAEDLDQWDSVLAKANPGKR